MSEATFTFRVDEALKNEFSTVAKTHDRTGAQLLRDFDFMCDYVKQQQEAAEYDVWLHAKGRTVTCLSQRWQSGASRRG